MLNTSGQGTYTTTDDNGNPLILIVRLTQPIDARVMGT
jgi:hypothetical protein